MTLSELVNFASDKGNFASLDDYIEFCGRYLDFARPARLQAVIVAQNEQQYRFFQYGKDGHFNITRPLNSNLLYGADDFGLIENDFLSTLQSAIELADDDEPSRALIRRSIYTLQQAIGATLDALPAGKSNTARKINGDLFERLIRLLINYVGVDCTTGTMQVPVRVDGVEQFKMSYQHDLIINVEGEIKAIGGVKTSSKDRLDKVFIDKFLYSRLTGTEVPHIAVFLNDVQRKNTAEKNRYGVNATFLPGHFKGYTLKLNPLDGVYYCDIRPNMVADALLREHIKTVDVLFSRDLWRFVAREGDSDVEIVAEGEPVSGDDE